MDEENDARDGVVKEVKEVKETPVKQKEVEPNFVSKLESSTVLTAVECLLRVVEESQKKKSNLIEESTTIQLQYNFKKIPQMKNKRLHARIPHSLVTDDTDACLIVKDVHKGAEDQEDKRDFTPSVRHFKQIVEEAGVKKVEEIIPVIQLKREYHDFEMQRKLCDSFDLFLCDERVSKFMPKLLGKNFYSKRKLPVNVKLHIGQEAATRTLKKALESVHGLITGQGSSTSVTVGHTGLSAQQTTDNAIAVVEQMVSVLPGGWPNISGLFLTTTKTTSIPLFVSTTSASSVELPPDVVEKKHLVASGDPGLFGDEENEDDEEGIVHVFDDGTVKIGIKKEVEEEEEEEGKKEGKSEKQEAKKDNEDGKKKGNKNTRKRPKKGGNKEANEKENQDGNKDGNKDQTDGEKSKRRRGRRGKSAKNTENESRGQSAPPAKKAKSDDAAKDGNNKPAKQNNKKTKAQKKRQSKEGASPAAKKTRIASIKGPLSKKPRLK